MTRMTDHPRISYRTIVAILSIALVTGCTDGSMPLAPGLNQSRSEGLGEHGGGPPGSVVYGSRADGGPPEIWVMNADGSDKVQLTNTPGPVAINGQPDWAPNAQSIVFMSTRTGNAEIFVIASDGSEATNLTNHPATDQAPVWSPNGKEIAFHSNRDGNFELYLLDVATGGVTRLTTHAGVDHFPDWSPNGKEIVFQRDGDIYVMELRTGEVSRLTSTPQMEDMPVWSPNGKQIAFMSARDGYPSVFVMNADGSDPVNITPRPAGVTTLWQSAWPGWSRDGKQIYFQGMRPEAAGDVEIFVTDADGGGNTARLTNQPGIDSAPVAR